MRKIMNWKLIVLSGLLLTSVDAVSPDASRADEAVLIYQSEDGAPLTTGSVTVKMAKIVEAGPNLKVTGQLHRPHKLLMSGHLHAFNYSKDGLLLAESKHQVPGLNSKRNGMMRIPFNIRIENAPIAAARVILKYHTAGHDEG
jgi:hypothetical protein